MIERRDVLKLISLAAMAVAGGGVLSACQSGSEAGGSIVARNQPGLVRSDVPRAAGDEAAAVRMVEALSATGGELYGVLAAQTPGNLAISPYYVLVAVALTLNGAAGETRSQLTALLGSADVATINAGLNRLTQQVEAQSGARTKADGTETEVVLAAANALFGQQGLTVGQPFLDALAREYDAGLHTVDYAADAAAARETVNAWTAEQTRDKIPQILPEGAVDVDTRLVLVNTLYLKAPWERPFDASATSAEPFTLLDGSMVPVDLIAASGPIADAAVVAGHRGCGGDRGRGRYHVGSRPRPRARGRSSVRVRHPRPRLGHPALPRAGRRPEVAGGPPAVSRRRRPARRSPCRCSRRRRRGSRSSRAPGG